MSKIARGIRSVNRTVNRLIRVRMLRRYLSTRAIIRWGMARTHCTSGRQRVTRRSASNSSRAGYGVDIDIVSPKVRCVFGGLGRSGLVALCTRQWSLRESGRVQALEDQDKWEDELEEATRGEEQHTDARVNVCDA